MAELIEAIADTVSPDEPCYGYVEVVVTPLDIQRRHGFVSAENWGRRRYGVTYVIRADRLACHVTEMGLQDDCLWPPFRVACDGEDTVGACWDAANAYKAGGYLWEKEIMAEAAGTSNVVEEFISQIEGHQKMVGNRSSFGAGYNKQRNGFPAEIRRNLERNVTR